MGKEEQKMGDEGAEGAEETEELTSSCCSEPFSENESLSGDEESDIDGARTVPDIGKLLAMGISLRAVSRDDIHAVLRSETHPNPKLYPRTEYRQTTRHFHPSWVQQYPWIHYSRHVDGVFCRACVCLLCSLLQSPLKLGESKQTK
eukprot:m.221005 g.221005  ORF g.221005 m.221005 type:complete len:146 (+) comp39951_c2_seq46:252-689(+)